MDNGIVFRSRHRARIKLPLSFLVVSLTGVLALLYFFANPYRNYLSIFSYENKGFIYLNTGIGTLGNSSNAGIIHSHKSDIGDDLKSDETRQIDDEHEGEETKLYKGSISPIEVNVKSHRNATNISTGEESIGTRYNVQRDRPKMIISGSISQESIRNQQDNAGEQIDHMPLNHNIVSGKSVLSMEANLSFTYNNQHKFKDGDFTEGGSNNISSMVGRTPLRKRAGKTMTISQMNLFLLNSYVGMNSTRLRWSSVRDRELQRARIQIENAPLRRNISEVHLSLFRNYSKFIRSYELMETMLKVYVYREGEKPIFHQPYMRGIYASEGWFMKMMEKDKQFVVKEPKKAHLFYLPFSSVKLRNALNGSGFSSQKDIEDHLKNYVDIISTKYRFWNKRGGADHFLVACHDWAPRFTRTILGSTIRVLCNTNIARGFRIGTDVSLPVTYIRSAENPSKYIGGHPPSKRPFLAFFAGGMHGYVRPILLQHWYNKEPDMKILGPMPRDDEGKTRYREFMQSSKYCICAKGYEVHTPRVVESIYYGCVPVIISDNYVPPFFEIFDWESFAVFILEDDIPKLRDILLSISEARYITMQRRLKILQRYFQWHKIPEKYDLFHMILHSVWHNRVFQVSART